MSRAPALFLSVFVIATCGLVYELLAGTLASYVLGDSVTQFSIVIGVYLSALGAGAWLSGFVEADLARRFVEVELAVALVGGASAPLLFLSFGKLGGAFHLVLYAVVLATGTLVGLELPLLMRILREHVDLKDLVARALAFDYLGALLASLAFPLFLVPRLGLVRTSLATGVVNAAVALWATWVLEPLLGPRVAFLRARGVVAVLLLVAGLAGSEALTTLSEESLYADDVVFARTSRYQRIVITRGRGGVQSFQLFLNGSLQLSSADEYRYHEALVHPAMVACASPPRRVLVLGGGDGLAVREVLRHPSVEEVRLVDLDPEMTSLQKDYPPLGELAGRSLSDPRVRIANEDAYVWLQRPEAPFDVAIVDFPDPNSFALGKLYTTRFYKMLRERLAAGASVSVQCTSPLFARQSYWCVVRTLEAAGFHVRPFHAAVPSFGVWGFALGRLEAFEAPAKAPPGLRFLDDAALRAIFVFPADQGPVDVEVNRLDNQVLVRYYEAEWRRWS